MKRAFVTLLCGGDAYLPGAEVLGRSLHVCHADAPRIVLVTEDVSANARQRLEKNGWEIREVRPIASPGHNEPMFRRFTHVFTKLRVWELLEFERVVFLDADTLVLRNIDDLFERHLFAAGPDFFLPDRFNSGVMVLEPSRDLFARMMRKLPETETYDGGDQGFLNTIFSDWYSQPAEHRLPATYNLPHFIYQFAQQHPAAREVLERDTRVLHYMVQKPWNVLSTLTGGSSPWWQMYFEAHPEESSKWKRKFHAFEDRTFNQLSSLVVS